MSEVLKQAEGAPASMEEPDFTIGEEDVRESLKTFVKGMSEEEKRRFLGIYRKY